jgi:hypothetical protein
METLLAWCFSLQISDAYACQVITEDEFPHQRLWELVHSEKLESVSAKAISQHVDNPPRCISTQTTIAEVKLTLTVPSIPLKEPSKNLESRAIQKVVLTPNIVWNIMLPSHNLQQVQSNVRFHHFQFISPQFQ